MNFRIADKNDTEMLMEMLLDRGRSEKLDFVELKATADGHALYSRLGFEENVGHYTPMKYKF